MRLNSVVQVVGLLVQDSPKTVAAVLIGNYSR